jgi:hypothetical protein
VIAELIRLCNSITAGSFNRLMPHATGMQADQAT